MSTDAGGAGRLFWWIENLPFIGDNKFFLKIQIWKYIQMLRYRGGELYVMA
jgi:hypothetical protein